MLSMPAALLYLALVEMESAASSAGGGLERMVLPAPLRRVLNALVFAAGITFIACDNYAA
jgi:hypothetical protein